jgi:hypothetical protein
MTPNEINTNETGNGPYETIKENLIEDAKIVESA